MMKKIINLYSALAVTLFLFSGCSESQDSGTVSDPSSVYLSVTRATANTSDDTINTDNTEYEDRVHDLAMLVFDSSTGAKVAEYYESDIPMTGSNTFVIKLIPGQRDFYFIANMPDMKTTLGSITKEDDLKSSYMNTLRDLDADLYQGATLDKGFPMSRVYLNQTITTGGNIYQPLPFYPNGEDKVKLIRVTAKLEVDFPLNGTSGEVGVKDVYFHNANRQFCLLNPSMMAPSSYFTDGMSLKKVDDHTFICYMPEAIISSATWSTSGMNQPVNYFTVETTEGKTYDIPIITDNTDITTDYLKKATGAESGYTPDYTIYRNHDYRFTINNLQKVEILYTVNDWNKDDKSLYMGYGYNVEVDGTTVTIKNTFQECPPFSVTLNTLNGTTFSDGTTTKTFTDVNSGASASFSLNAEPVSGDYLQVVLNGETVKTFTK
jgi:hypothetical protein